MPYIDSINTNQTDYLISGVASIIICDTQANEQNKTAIAMDAFNLDSNLSFKIKFTYGNTANNPTLNLNNTGSKPILTTTSDFNLLSDTVYNCYYNGTNYIIDNQLSIHINDTNNPHNVTKSIIGLGNVDNTRDSDKSVLSATKLTNARNIYVNLSNTDTSFTTDFSTTAILPIYGILDASHGGTGVSSLSSLKESMNLNNVDNTRDSDKSVLSATKLTTPRNVFVDFTNTQVSYTTDFSKNTINLPIWGILDASHGGTGVSSLSSLKECMNLNNVDNTHDSAKHVSFAENASCASNSDYLCGIEYNDEYTADYITGVKHHIEIATLQSYRIFSDGFLIQYGTLCACESCIRLPVSYYNNNYKFFYTHDHLDDTCTTYTKFNDHICFSTTAGGADCFDWMTIGLYTENI